MQNTETVHRPIYEIARDIDSNWKNVYFGARPYLNALHSLRSYEDNFGADSAHDMIIYFLANATTWRGEHARRIKAELKNILLIRRKK